MLQSGSQMLIAAADPANHFFWLASRSVGLVAIGLLSFSVSLGLLVSGRLSEKPGRKRTLIVLHETGSMLALALIAAHGALLLGDNYLSPSWYELVFPFAISYKPVSTGIGIIGAWIVVLLGLSFYIRRYVGAAVWAKLHRFVLAAWVLSMFHAIGSGTDMSSLSMKIYILLQAVVVSVLLIARLIPYKSKEKRAVSRSVNKLKRTHALYVHAGDPGGGK